MSKIRMLAVLAQLLLGGTTRAAVAWTDGSGKKAPDMVKVLAPIHDPDIRIAESWPLQYFLHVVPGCQTAAPNSIATA
jgi:hypothetical protein